MSGIYIADIAWDWVNKRMYWTDVFNKEIRVYDPLTNIQQTVIHTGHRFGLNSIVVDPNAG